MPPSMPPSMPRTIAVAACLAVVALAGGCATSHAPVAGAPAAATAAATAPLAIPGLRTPRPGLLTAGQPAASDWERLAGDGVVAVVNLRPEAEMKGRDARAEV